FLDLKALMGDSSDNIPGVAGIGKKGATDLLQEYKTLDNIYENLDLIKNSVRTKLEAGKESAYLSKKLAMLWTDAPVELELDELDVQKCDPMRVKENLQKLEFRTLLRQLPEAMQMPVDDQAAVPTGDFTSSHTTVQLITSDQELKQVIPKEVTELYVYTRSAGTYGNKPLVLLCSFDGTQSYHI